MALHTVGHFFCGKHACVLWYLPRGEPKRPFLPVYCAEKAVEFCELSLIMPPSKVCPQCDAVVHIRLKVCKSCQHVFRAKRQIEHTLPARAMKQLRVSLSDIMKSVQKAKEKLQRACKGAAESSKQTLHRQQQNREQRESSRV